MKLMGCTWRVGGCSLALRRRGVRILEGKGGKEGILRFVTWTSNLSQTQPGPGAFFLRLYSQVCFTL